MADSDYETDRSATTRISGTVAWLSLCLVAAGWGPEIDANARILLTRAGLFGLVAAVGFGTVQRTRRRRSELQEQAAVTRRSSIAVERFLRPYQDGGTPVASQHLTDRLTGLFTRSYLLDLLEYEVPRARRYGWPLALLLADVPGLAEVNRADGQAAGDELLRQMAQTLKASLRGGDTVVRYGGAQFAAILPHTDRSGLRLVIDRIRESIPGRSSDGHPVALTAIQVAGEPEQPDSGGIRARLAIAIFPDDGDDPQALLAHLERSAGLPAARGRCQAAAVPA